MIRANKRNIGKQLSSGQAGATAVEYGLLAALLAFGILVSLRSLG